MITFIAATAATRFLDVGTRSPTDTAIVAVTRPPGVTRGG
jgi:hypothetical protein